MNSLREWWIMLEICGASVIIGITFGLIFTVSIYYVVRFFCFVSSLRERTSVLKKWMRIKRGKNEQALARAEALRKGIL